MFSLVKESVEKSRKSSGCILEPEWPNFVSQLSSWLAPQTCFAALKFFSNPYLENKVADVAAELDKNVNGYWVTNVIS